MADGAAMLLVLLCRGPGKLLIDHLLWQRLRAKLDPSPVELQHAAEVK